MLLVYGKQDNFLYCLFYPIDWILFFFVYLNLSYRSNNGRGVAAIDDSPKRIKPPSQTEASEPWQSFFSTLPQWLNCLILKYYRIASSHPPLLCSIMGKNRIIKCCVCKTFAPLLKAFYEEVNLEEKRLEIIYVGFDKVKKDFESYTKTMPWIGLPFSDEKIPGLKEFYDVRAVPKLILLDSRGE